MRDICMYTCSIGFKTVQHTGFQASTMDVLGLGNQPPQLLFECVYVYIVRVCNVCYGCMQIFWLNIKL